MNTIRAFLIAQVVKNPPAMPMLVTLIPFLGLEDPLENGWATHSDIFGLPLWLSWIMEKAREFQKNIYFCFIDYGKAFDCVDHNKLENSEIYGNTRPPDPLLEKPICRSGSNS